MGLLNFEWLGGRKRESGGVPLLQVEHVSVRVGQRLVLDDVSRIEVTNPELAATLQVKPVGPRKFLLSLNLSNLPDFTSESLVKSMQAYPGRPGAQTMTPPEAEAIWKKFAQRKTASPKVWMDAYLAAFAIAGSFQLVTTDNDFKQFNGLNSLVLPK